MVKNNLVHKFNICNSPFHSLSFFRSIKKAISPVIATALLLVVAVVAVVGFQTWFGSYSSSMFTKVETQSNEASSDGTLAINTLIGNTLYVKNGVTDNISINSLKIGGIICNVTQNLSLGINEINVTTCLLNLSTNTPSIVLTTNTKILDKQVYLKDITPNVVSESSFANCSAIDGIQLNHTQAAVFYNSSSGFSTCYSQTRTCNDGNVNGTSSYNNSTCISYYDLSCSTDNDADGFINSSCANYPMTNTSFIGSLDTNDNNNTIYPDMSCIFNSGKNTTSCINNFVVDGCGSGTVLDVSTGLCWQRDMTNAGVKNWTDAINYCSGLNLGGTGFRLPSLEELISITDLSQFNPAIVGGNNNKFQNVVNNYYWTYSTYGPSTTDAWVVGFHDGFDSYSVKTSTFYVVCVR